MSDKSVELPEIRTKLKELLISELSLQDIKAEDIKENEALFGEGLGLDSLDAVEIFVILQRHFGVEVKEMDRVKEIFYSVETLSNYIYESKNEK